MLKARTVAGLAVVAACALAPAGSARAANGDAAQAAALHGISEADAERRLALEQDVGALETDARRRWPETFAGLWMGRGAAPTVRIAFTRDAARNVADLATGFPRPVLLSATGAERSLAELEGLAARVVAERDAVQAGRASVPGLADHRYAVDVDVRRNVVVVTAPRPTAATEAALRSRHGDAIVVESGSPGGPNGCTRDACLFSLRSGMWTNGCSTAFAVNPSRQILSAGHCGGTTQVHYGWGYGSVGGRQVSGKVDAQRHWVNAPEFSARGWIFVDGTTRARPVTSRGSYSGLSIGATVCKSGVTTGRTCGTVGSKTYAPWWVSNSSSFIRVDGQCAKDGDSGAGVYINNQAVGIHSGGDDDQICGNGNDIGIFGHIEYAQTALGVTTITSESAPTFDDVTAYNGQYEFRVHFRYPVSCSTVSTSDFTARIGGVVPVTLTGESCTEDSEKSFRIYTSQPMIAADYLEVSLVGSVTDPGGNTAPTTSRGVYVQP